jgi:hypothetical protein
MAIPHGERCFCDKCIAGRQKARRAAVDRAKDAEAYIKRRGGLDRPANSKLKRESDGET